MMIDQIIRLRNDINFSKTLCIIYIYAIKIIDLEVLHIRKKLPKLNRIYFESSTNVLKCL